ncbi:sensor histidine kinase [Microbacterium dauci]|uniref:histidine kinase n=1 Tax=Microbacterium dauci TaxID=3048008 RepID=A0ABT6ZET6_9MICO|nr:sensor histidine kinase [Microbacterium sp. LX3-4]MDJ1114225.1 sensor histidine kinase [Microbacterium sp. LX3-4]
MTVSSLRRAATPAELRADAWLAAGMLVAGILSTALGSTSGVYGGEHPDLWWGLVYAAALTLPLVLRRRFPSIVLIAVSSAYFVGVSLQIPEVYVGNVAIFIAMYTVGAWVADRRRAAIVRVIVIIAMLVWLLVSMFQAAASPDNGFSQEGPFSPFVAFAMLQFLINIAFFGGAYMFGERAYTSAVERAELEARTAELERERELTAAQAVALDRVRIARELHDVVAHHVSAMGVQAGAARTVLDRDPDAAKSALAGIETAARDALTELRQLLETLRTPDADAPGGSTLRLSALSELTEHATANGLPTTLSVVGTPIEPSELVQVNLYRIAQEALTNARRHGGPGATADVRVRYDADAVELEVANTGRAPISGRAGLGLVGMRERAAASGGTVEAGARGRGGFLVRARVPLSRPATVGADT